MVARNLSDSEVERVICSRDIDHIPLAFCLYFDNRAKVAELFRASGLSSFFGIKAFQQLAIFVDLNDIADRNRWNHIAFVANGRDPSLLRKPIARFANWCTVRFTTLSEVHFRKKIARTEFALQHS